MYLQDLMLLNWTSSTSRQRALDHSRATAIKVFEASQRQPVLNEDFKKLIPTRESSCWFCLCLQLIQESPAADSAEEGWFTNNRRKFFTPGGMKTLYPIFENSWFEKQELAVANIQPWLLRRNNNLQNQFFHTTFQQLNSTKWVSCNCMLRVQHYGLRVWWEGSPLCFVSLGGKRSLPSFFPTLFATIYYLYTVEATP